MAKKFYKPSSQGGDQKAIEEKALKRFADLMISRMERMRDTKWEQGWTSGAGYGLPQNIKTGVLHGSNRLILAMDTVMNGYKMPLYLTFNQALDIECCVKKDQKSVPVVYSIPFYKDKDGIMRKGYFPKAEESADIDRIPGTHASCSLLANLVFNKYHMNTPVYREMVRLLNNKMNVSRNTVYNWFVKGSEYLNKVLPS